MQHEFARVTNTLFVRVFSIAIIKAGFAMCGIHPFDPNAQSKIMASFSSLSTDELSSSGTSATAYPCSSNMETSCAALSVPSSEIAPSHGNIRCCIMTIGWLAPAPQLV